MSAFLHHHERLAHHTVPAAIALLAVAVVAAIVSAFFRTDVVLSIACTGIVAAAAWLVVAWRRDVANRRALRALHEVAERANLAKSQFLARMSHELRTPLNAIIGFAEVLEVNTDRRLSDSEVEYAACIRTGGKQLHRLIDDVLDLARVEAGKLEFKAVPVATTEVFRELQGLFHTAALKAGIALSILESCSPFEVTADETRLRQVLTNLVSNGIKYNRPGGKVEVRAVVARPGVARFEIQDDGLGIPPGQADSVFEPFNRLGREHSKIEGSGIGLALTRWLVQGMKGEIGFSSQPGKGTLFWVELPCSMPCTACDAVAVRSRLAVLDPGVAQPTTILYIEDVPSNVDVVRTILSYRPDVRLVDAPDAVRGIEAARSERPDLILLDIQLPGVSGLEAIRLLKGCPQVTDVPIIALTAAAMPIDIERGRKAGFDQYLTKPIEPAEFLSCIDAALESRGRRSNSPARDEVTHSDRSRFRMPGRT